MEDNGLLEVQSGPTGRLNINLQCIEHVESGFTNLMWIVLPDNGSLIIPTSSAGKENNVYSVIKSGNQANLTIDNSMNPFRGLLKCSSSSSRIVSVRIVEGEI